MAESKKETGNNSKNNSKNGIQPFLQGSIYEKAETSPGLLFWRAFHNWTRKIKNELQELNLTQPQYSMIAAISYLSSTGRDVSQQDVANQLSMDKMTVSEIIKILMRKKLVTRKISRDDKRAMALDLTSEAKTLLKQATSRVEKVDEGYFRHLPPEELHLFMLCLEKLSKEK